MVNDELDCEFSLYDHWIPHFYHLQLFEKINSTLQGVIPANLLRVCKYNCVGFFLIDHWNISVSQSKFFIFKNRFLIY